MNAPRALGYEAVWQGERSWKQGNRMLRWLLVEAVQIAVRFEGMKKQYLHRCHQKPKGVAKVAMARKLAVRL